MFSMQRIKTGAVGTTGRMLEQITLSSGTLMAISFIIIVGK